MHAELGEHVAHVRLDRLRADVELLRDALVAHALGKQLEDLSLALGQRLEQRQCVPPRLPLARDLVQQPSEGGRVDEHLSLGGGFRGREDLVGGLVLAEEPRGAGLDGIDEQTLVVVRRHDHDLRRRRRLLDSPGRLDPVDASLEDDVHEHDVGVVLAADLDGLLGGVDRRGDEPKLRVALHDHRERVRQDLVVVADDQRARLRSLFGHGLSPPTAAKPAGWYRPVPRPRCPIGHRAR
jgi:hypothetical protein